MKKRILLFTLVAGLGSVVFSSYHGGAAISGYDCTGAESAGTGMQANPTGCAASGSGCHATSATTGITVAMELDSAGTPTTYWKAGHTYTVKITGTNTTGNTLPKYGFQIAALKGTTSAATEHDAGTLSGAPAGTHITAAVAPYTYVQLSIAEQSSAIALSGTSFTQSFTWTAPAAGTGSVSFWGAANFVNGNGVQDAGDLWNTTHITATEIVSNAGVASIGNELTVKVYPNPATTSCNLQLLKAEPGTYALQIFSMNGSAVITRLIEVNNAIESASINTSNWASGLYNVVIEKDGNKKSLIIVKQ